MPSPNGKAAVLNLWRTETRWKAYGLIAASAAGAVSNGDMAQFLGIDSHGLRNIIQMDPHFTIEYRWSSELSRGVLWYSINHALKHGPPEPPKLLRIVEGKCRNDTMMDAVKIEMQA